MYNEKANKRANKYKAEKQKHVSLAYKKEDYENIIFPAICKSGLPVASFIKQAIMEKIERDHLND